MEEFIIGLATKYPVLVSILSMVGMLRLIFKPLMGFLHSVADVTPSAKDNEILAEVEGSKFYKSLVWFLDYVASIKILPKS